MDNFTTMTKAELLKQLTLVSKERDAARCEICEKCEFRPGDRHEVKAWHREAQRRGWDCYEQRKLVGKGKA